MKSAYKTLTIKKQADGYTIFDSDDSPLITFERLFDAAIMLRYLMCKSMSRAECDFVSSLLKDFDMRMLSE